MHCRKWQVGFGRRIGQAVDDKRKLEEGRATHAGPTVGARPGLRRFGLGDNGGGKGGQAVGGFRWCFHCLFWWILLRQKHYGGRLVDLWITYVRFLSAQSGPYILLAVSG